MGQSVQENIWAKLEFLIGDWLTGNGGDTPGTAGSGSFTFSPELSGKVLVRKNHAEYPSLKGRPGTLHDDLMIIYRQGDATKALYDDSDGLVVHYDVRVSSDKERIVFVSEENTTGPRYRLTYLRIQPDVVKLIFETATADKPDQFTLVVEALAQRKRSALTHR